MSSAQPEKPAVLEEDNKTSSNETQSDKNVNVLTSSSSDDGNNSNSGGSGTGTDQDSEEAKPKACTYKDYSRVLPEKRTPTNQMIEQSNATKEPTFPIKLHMILSNPGKCFWGRFIYTYIPPSHKLTVT